MVDTVLEFGANVVYLGLLAWKSAAMQQVYELIVHAVTSGMNVL